MSCRTIRWLRRTPLGWEVPGAILVFAVAAAFRPGKLAFVELSRGAGDNDTGRAARDGFLLLRDSGALVAGAMEIGRASLVELVAASQRTSILPSRTVPVIRADGTPVTEPAVQHLDVWGPREPRPRCFASPAS